MSDTIFVNSTAKDWKDYFQARCIAIGSTQQQLDNAPFIFESSVPCTNEIPCVCLFEFEHGPYVIHKGLVFASKPDALFIVEPKTKLSTLMLKSGMLVSKNEFFRKLKQKGITYNDNKVESDIEIDVSVPSISHEVRFGKRFLEIVVPTMVLEKEETTDVPVEPAS